MFAILRDIQHAARSLAKSPGFVAIAVITLALGLGANLTLFSVAHQLLLKRLAVDQPDQLYWVHRTLFENEMRVFDGESVDISRSHSILLQEALEESMESSPISGSTAISGLGAVLASGDRAFDASVQLVNGGYFQLLGVRALHGRALRPQDDQPGVPTVLVLEHDFWRDRFGADPAVIGATVKLRGQPVEVIGVAPEGFEGLSYDSRVDAWAALSAVDQIQPSTQGDDRRDPRRSSVRQVVRLRPGVNVEQARSFVELAINRVRPGADNDSPPLEAFLELAAFGDPDTHQRWAAPMQLLAGACGLLLLIACVNVVNLLLARAIDRRGESAVRLALGARPFHIVRQRMVESGLIALLGCAAAWMLTWYIEPLAKSWVSVLGPESGRADPAVLGFAAVITFVCALMCGAVPSWASLRKTSRLTGGERVAGPRSNRLRGVFVASQVALCLPALVGAILLLRSLDNLSAVDKGLDPSHTMMATLDPLRAGFERDRLPSLFREILSTIRALPEVESAAIGTSGALSGSSSWSPISPDNAGEGFPGWTAWSGVTADYFETLRMQLQAGRVFDRGDTAESAAVAIVNRSYARSAFGDLDPVGRVIVMGRDNPANIEIVGVVADAKYQKLREEPTPVVYFPYWQQARQNPKLYVRGSTPEGLSTTRLSEVVQSVAPGLPVSGVRSVSDQIGNTLRRERMLSTLLTILGLIGLALTATGLFGVTSYVASRRTREVGLRMALGALRSDIVRIMVGGGLRWVALGCAIGTVASVASGRLLEASLYGVTATDPVSIGIGIGVLLLVGGAATYGPARRAAAIEPMVALRDE